MHRSSQWRKSDQLLVCFGSHRKESKQTISKWIVEAISTAYEVGGFPTLKWSEWGKEQCVGNECRMEVIVSRIGHRREEIIYTILS